MVRHARMRRPPGALPARASTTRRSPPSSCSTGSSPRRARAAPVAGSRALPRADARVRRRHPRGDPRPAAAARRLAATGAACASRWTRARRAAVRVAFERLYGDGLAYRAEALVNWCPGCRTSVSDLEVDPDPRDRARCGPSATTSSTRRPAPPDPDATVIRRHHAPRDDPRRHRRRRAPGRRRATRRSSAGCVRIPFVERDVPIIADDGRRAGVRDGRGQDHAGPRPRRLRDRQAPRPRDAHDPRRRRAGRRHRHGLRRARSLRGARRRSSRTSRRAATWSATRPHEMVIGRCQRSDDVVEPRLKTQWFVRTGPLAASRARGDPGRRDADPARAVRQGLGALDDEHPRLERVAGSCGGATGSRPGTARTAT